MKKKLSQYYRHHKTMLFFDPVISGHKDPVEASLAQVTGRDYLSNQDNVINLNLSSDKYISLGGHIVKPKNLWHKYFLKLPF